MKHLQGLKSAVMDNVVSPDVHVQRMNAIRRDLLGATKLIDSVNFSWIKAGALERAFDSYDQMYLDGHCRALLHERNEPIDFQLSKRMTRTGGMTVRQEEYGDYGQADASTRFTIKISSVLLFQSFRNGGAASVSGCHCHNRLDAFLRIVEHELIHLVEMLLWYDSSCSRRRFRQIAQRLFGHTESTHQLITPIELARGEYGISPGDRVEFQYEGRSMRGLVNRITRRATILVPDKRGERYSDGRRYMKYYVPLACLKRSVD